MLFTSTSRDYWSEFVKCLDLYSQDAISRKDMLQLVQGLFGPVHSNLFEEFRALLNHRSAYNMSVKDMWANIPLSEIDFRQCQRCTPSYCALPKEYPRPVCSEQSAVHTDILNSEWISIPVGSEEILSFKNMGRNHFEDALFRYEKYYSEYLHNSVHSFSILFRCEDERFEIDMAIDSNLSTLKILEPLAEEIAQAQLRAGGTRSKKINLQLESRDLGVIHLSSIARIYGESGSEVLELLKKNPIGAIPVIVRRLKQKDVEWGKVRQELNKSWKEITDKNYERSFDHQVVFFKLHDKRFFSTKTLVNDIKGGNSEMEQYLLQVAPGISREVPVGLMDLFGDMRPHLAMAYDASDQGALRDVYRLICHAMEVSSLSASDKQGVVSLWRDLLRVFFNMPVHFLYRSDSWTENAVYKSETSAGVMTSEVSRGEEKYSMSMPLVEVFDVGTKVLTLYGSGRIQAFRSSDNTYQVSLPFGVGFLRPSVLLGVEELSAPALRAIGVTTDEQVNFAHILSRVCCLESNPNPH